MLAVAAYGPRAALNEVRSAVARFQNWRLNSPAAQAEFQAQVKAAAAKYKRDERPKGYRGDLFVDLCETMDHPRYRGLITEAALLRFLGPPDAVQTTWGTGKVFAYYWSRSAKDDWVVYVSVRGGVLEEVSFTARSVVVPGQWQPYPATAPTTRLTTRPVDE